MNLPRIQRVLKCRHPRPSIRDPRAYRLLIQRLAILYPDDTGYQSSLARTQYELGVLCRLAGHPEEAEEADLWADGGPRGEPQPAVLGSNAIWHARSQKQELFRSALHAVIYGHPRAGPPAVANA